MLFCPKCGALMLPANKDGKKFMKCSRCNFVDKDVNSAKLTEKVKEAKEIPIIEKEVETNPICKAFCTKCKNKEAYYWEVQTRSGDEPPTRFFKCCKCSKVWKEY